MAEAAVLASLGWLVSPLMNKLFNKAYDYLGTSIDESMKILVAKVLPHLSLAIEKAENSSNKEKLVDWLERLKGAYYEAEEAIDLFEYELLKQKVKDDRKTLEQKEKNERGSRISFPSQFAPPCFKLKYGLSVFSQKKIMLKGRIDKLIKIANEADEFGDLLHENATGSNSDYRETISEPHDRIFGREIDKENIVNLLTKISFNSEPGPSTRPAIPIIAIIGRSGVGKTVLAQYIYKHMDIHEHFDLLVWVHAPHKFKATDVLSSMIEKIEAKEGTHKYNPSNDLQTLFLQIRRMVGCKKLLLVLDDFWSDTGDFVEQWENFIRCLPESRILLTAQSKNVAQIVDLPNNTEVETYLLHPIEDGHFLELFIHHAWDSTSNLPKEEFEKIGRLITVKLKGDPGAAKLVGQQLRRKLDLRHWEEVAEKDWLGDNMKARIWSYQHLPQNLQRCFAICSLFPKGTKLPGPLLIGLWMAEGYISPRDKEERLEDIGENYLYELVARFFLEEVVFKEEKHYQLHDLLQDLAKRVQGDDFIRIDSPNSIKDPSHISEMLSRSENIRHIYIPSSMISKLKDKLCLMKNICTFCVENDGSLISRKVLQKILKHLQKLRVLYLPECGDELPDSIGNLKHLRFLRRYGSGSLNKLPDSICKLYHLQTLELPNCQSLPKNICELISLRRFYTVGQTMSHISHVGRLTSLQELVHFVVRKEYGYELHQLENLNQLRGEMHITGLENVASTKDAIKANMQNKTHLTTLEFEWNSDERDSNNSTCLSTPPVELLNALQPHPRISGLTLKGFRGDRIPNWLQSQNSLNHLKLLTIMDCDKVKQISSIDESLPNCERLILRGLKNLKRMPTFPPNLTSIEISNIPQVSYFSEDDLLKKEKRNQSKHEVVKQILDCLKPDDVLLPRNFESNVKHFFLFLKHRLEAAFDDSPDLLLDEWAEILTFDPWNKEYSREQILDAWVMFMHCDMETMFYKNEESKLVLPSSLTYLVISSCSITDDALSPCIQCLISLSKLELSFIQTITSLPPKEVLCSLNHLKSLTIKGCFLLSSLGGIGALTSLIELKLENCPNLNISDDSLPSSLERLQFRYCSSVDVIHALNVLSVIRSLDVGNLSLLKELVLIGWYGNLEGFNSLTALRSLHLLYCPAINLSSPMEKYAFALEDVIVDDLKLLKLILSNETISSIYILTIFGFQGDSSDDEVFQSLTSLKGLGFYSCKTTNLPKNLKNCSSVQYLKLDDCPNLCKLEELPRNLCSLEIENCPKLCELEELPRNLHELQIKDCPTLAEKFKKSGRNLQVRFDEGYTIVTFPTEEEGNRC